MVAGRSIAVLKMMVQGILIQERVVAVVAAKFNIWNSFQDAYADMLLKRVADVRFQMPARV